MKVPSIREVVCLAIGFILASALTYSITMDRFETKINNLMDKASLIDANLDIADENLDTLFHLVTKQQRQIDSLQKVHPWKQWSKK